MSEITWGKLTDARRKLGLTEEKMANLLAVGVSTYKGWGTRGKVPPYIAASVEAHLMLSKAQLAGLMKARL